MLHNISTGTFLIVIFPTRLLVYCSPLNISRLRLESAMHRLITVHTMLIGTVILPQRQKRCHVESITYIHPTLRSARLTNLQQQVSRCHTVLYTVCNGKAQGAEDEFHEFRVSCCLNKRAYTTTSADGITMAVIAHISIVNSIYLLPSPSSALLIMASKMNHRKSIV